MQIQIPISRKYRTMLIRAIITLVLFLLVLWAFKSAPIVEIWLVLSKLKAWQLVTILLVNTFLYLMISLRWWIIVRSQRADVPFWDLVPVRIAVFGISYFTLGPQVGGETLQIVSLTRNFGLSYSRAAASVFLDKLFEFLTNFVFLGLGIFSIMVSGLFIGKSVSVLFWTGLLLIFISWPVIHILLLKKRIYPLKSLLRQLMHTPRSAKIIRFICAAEWLAGRFCQQRTRELMLSVGVSLLAGLGMVMDYALMLFFLGINLQVWQVIAGWTSAWLSFLAPLPGGLGALEASQVAALGVFGVSAAAAISITILMRARDLLFGGLGMLFAGRIYK